ncbi:MAG: glycosyltransferase [Oscillospiraceae bacterium]|nr:glycosyltransferase [Oscillospiraceae bacterium]
MNKKLHAMLEKHCPVLYYRMLQKKRAEYEARFAAMTPEEMRQRDDELYFKHVGKHVNWDDPHAYTEKMQIAKLEDKNPLKAQLADKYAVRKWVADKIGEEYLVPLCGAFDNADDIDFDKLPKSFVIKTNSGSGDAIIVHDKATLSAQDQKIIRAKMNYQMHCNYACGSFEMHYSDIKPKVIVERLIECDEDDLPDYKFICFDGKPYYCWVDMGRYHQHKRNVYDLEWNLQDWNQKDYGNYEGTLEKPKNFEKMIELATVLCQGFHHVRVDFYNVNGTIYFGEMTFTNGSGFEPIIPYEADLKLGELWNLRF